jgi:ribosomal protein S1
MDFRDLDLTELDKDLSEEQQKEWNAIYASWRAGSILTGRVVGVDTTTITLPNKETGKPERVAINCLVVISYRVKVLIPEQQVWFDEKTTRPEHVLRSMTGAVIDYVITGIDRESDCCTASRRSAMYVRRKAFTKLTPKVGKKVSVNVIAVGAAHLLANCGGFDTTLSQRDLSYGMLGDLRDKFHPGETLTAILKEYDEENQSIKISVKEAEPHPFDGVEVRHPLNCRRASTISGKYKGGVFCKLEENLDCLCTYSMYQCDEDFNVEDKVIVVITKYDYERKLVYGKIVAKW